MVKMIYDIVIVGAGPAGLTSALYAKRSGLEILVTEKFTVGGQVVTTYEVENYPGFLNISGMDLISKMEEQVKALGVNILHEEVVEIKSNNEIKTVITKTNQYQCKTVILTMGANPKLLEVPGEQQYMGKGVSYCATCDGNFFRNKEVVVVGGGNTAVEDAIFLSRICSKVFLVHRRDTFRAEKNLVDNMLKIENIEILYDTVTEEIVGENLMSGVKVKNIKTNEQMTMVLSQIMK
jgi:thioredoxin reductase (NADPH)